MSMRVTEWPNKLGMDVKVRGGEWACFKPDCGRPWRANFIPNGAEAATRAGEGDTMEAAIAAAQSL